MAVQGLLTLKKMVVEFGDQNYKSNKLKMI